MGRARMRARTARARRTEHPLSPTNAQQRPQFAYRSTTCGTTCSIHKSNSAVSCKLISDDAVSPKLSRSKASQRQARIVNRTAVTHVFGIESNLVFALY